MEKINKSKVSKKSLLFILVSTVIMVIYELIKQFIFPKISIWESHLVTIIFVSIISACFAFLYFKNAMLIKKYKEELNKNVNYRMN